MSEPDRPADRHGETGSEDPRRRRHGTSGDGDPRADDLACLDAQEREFLRAGEEVGPGDRVRLDRLERAVRAEVLRGVTPERSPRSRLLPYAIPALAAAAVAIFLLLMPRGESPDRGGTVLRGEAPNGFEDLRVAVTVENGAAVARFEWAPRPDADSYEVLILGADRATVARLETGAATRAEWPVPTDVRGSPLEWVVVARREGREVARSRVEALPTGSP